MNLSEFKNKIYEELVKKIKKVFRIKSPSIDMIKGYKKRYKKDRKDNRSNRQSIRGEEKINEAK